MSSDRTLETEVILSKPVSEVFPFFADAKNLERITPPWLHFRILDQSTPEIGEGTIFNYKLRIRGVPIHWRSKITKWKDNDRFMDMQLKGPYSKWEHLHTFEEHPNGTLMRDIVHYKVPLGIVGDFVAGWYVKRDVEKIFEYRKQEILKIFNS